ADEAARVSVLGAVEEVLDREMHVPRVLALGRRVAVGEPGHAGERGHGDGIARAVARGVGLEVARPPLVLGEPGAALLDRLLAAVGHVLGMVEDLGLVVVLGPARRGRRDEEARDGGNGRGGDDAVKTPHGTLLTVVARPEAAAPGDEDPADRASAG